MPTVSLRVAAVQPTSTDDVARNLAVCADLVADAAARGARLVALPENFAYLGGMPCGTGPRCVACGPAKRCYEEPRSPKGEPWLQCITFCEDDSHCDPGFHCDPAYGTCVEGEPS